MATTTTGIAPSMEYAQWLNQIDFYKQELKKMQLQLEQFIPTFYSKDFAARVEQFQNRFIRQREVIDILRHDVKAHENDLERLKFIPSDAMQQKVARTHKRLKNDVLTFVDLFVELEQDFNDFIA